MKNYILVLLVFSLISCNKVPKLNFQYNEVNLSQSTKTLLDVYISGYNLNPDEVKIHLFNNMNTKGQFIDDNIIIKTNPKRLDTGRVDTIKNLYFTRYKGFSIDVTFPHIDERFFKFNMLKKESVDMGKFKFLPYRYGEFPLVWILTLKESKIETFDIRDNGNYSISEDLIDNIKEIEFDKSY